MFGGLTVVENWKLLSCSISHKVQNTVQRGQDFGPLDFAARQSMDRDGHRSFYKIISKIFP